MLTSTTTSSSNVRDLERASWLRTRYSDVILKAQQYMKQRANEKHREVSLTELEAEMKKKQWTREKEKEISHMELEAKVTKKQQARKREREPARTELKADVTKKQRYQVPDLDRATCLKTRYSSDIILKAQQHKPEAESTKNPQRREQGSDIGRGIKMEAEVMKKQRATKEEREAARVKMSKIAKTVDLEDNWVSVRDLEMVAGCSLGCVIDRREDGEVSKVIMGGFQGIRFWNPLEKIGLRPKD